mgnify:CR=1 FL=1
MTKLTVIGAGAVGSSIAYAALIRSTVSDLMLFDLDHARAEAEAQDLGHGAQHVGSVRISSAKDLTDTANSDVVVITAGAKRKPGQTRLELLAINESIVVDMIPTLLEHSPEAKIVIVSNPCDVLATRAVQKHNLDPKQVFSSGNVLDTARLAWVLAGRLGVSVESVQAMVLGEHGDSQFPVWSQARIGDVPILEYSHQSKTLKPSELDEIAEQVKTAGAAVIAGKGATNYGIGLSTIRIVEAILNDENLVLPVSSVLDDYLGVSGVALSVPTLVNGLGAAEPKQLTLNEDEMKKLLSSANAIEESVHSLD